jgi:hypothetical protein
LFRSRWTTSPTVHDKTVDCCSLFNRLSCVLQCRLRSCACMYQLKRRADESSDLLVHRVQRLWPK